MKITELLIRFLGPLYLPALDLGLASLDPFLGVPGGEGWGVGPFPFARDSPVP